jgi:hypothetical protein
MNRKPLLSAIVAALIIASALSAVGMSPPVYSDKIIGPASATDNAVMLFDGTTGKLAKEAPITTISDEGYIQNVGDGTSPHALFLMESNTSTDYAFFAFSDTNGKGFGSADAFLGLHPALLADTFIIFSQKTVRLFTTDETNYSNGITITTGDSSAQRSGDVHISTGSAGGSRGDVSLLGRRIAFDGSLVFDRTAVADAGHTAADGEYLIAYTSLSATRTVALPTAVGRTGQAFLIKDESGLAAPGVKITIDPDGIETIDGVATIDIVTPYGAIEAYSSGAAWFTK